jgi:hypothetical protein
VTPHELTELRAVYTAIRDGQATWQDTIEMVREQRGEEAPQAAQPSKVAKGAQAVKDKLAGRKTAPVATPAPAPQAAAPAQAAEPVHTPGSGPVKRPSRSKAAQAERAAEMQGMEVVNEKAAGLYLAYGDPRNREKGYSGELETVQTADGRRSATPEAVKALTVEEHEARSEASHQAAQDKLDAERLKAKAALEQSSTAHNPETGEVIPDPNEEPEWMRGGPPPDEEF